MKNLVYILQKEYFEKRKTMSMYALGGLGAMLVMSIFGINTNNVVGGSAADFYGPFFGLGLFLLGFIFTSTAFSDAHKRTTQHEWLMLPASTADKFIAKVLVSGVFYGISLIFYLALSSLLIEGINSLLWGSRYPFFNPFRGEVWKAFFHYMVAQSVFLLGAAYFRKSNFIKTILAILGLVFFFSLIASVLGRIIFQPYLAGSVEYWGTYLELNSPIWAADQELQEIFLRFFNTIEVIYWAITAPFCWTVTYIRLKEVESKDAV